MFNTWQVILFCIGFLVLADVVRALFLSLFLKKVQIISVVSDTEQARLESLSKFLNVPVTEIVSDKGTYYDVNKPETVYNISCEGSYVFSINQEKSEQTLETSQETE